jgi:CRP/FNR family transcriptional regulator, cyclic AMP receptor protein
MSPSTLADIELFADLPETELQLLEQRCRRRKYLRNEQILERDSESRDVYFVIDGAAQVASYAKSGRVIMLDTIPAGGHFGELSAIDDQPRSAIVTATEDSLIASMSPMDFDELLSRNAEVMRRVLKRLAHIIRDGNERITDLNTLGSVHRVYVELLRLAGPDPAVPRLWSIYPLPTQADLAARASTSRETVGRVLGRLAKTGLIERKGKTVYIPDPEALKTLVDRRRREEPYDGPERRKERPAERWYEDADLEDS